MSEEKLKFTQRMFALLERLTRETRVKDLNMSLNIGTDSLDFTLSTNIKSTDFKINANVIAPPFYIKTQSMEIVQDFTHPRLNDAAMDVFNTQIIEEDLNSFRAAVVKDEKISFSTTTKVIDWFAVLNVDNKDFASSLIKYNSTAKDLKNFTKDVNFELLKPKIHQVPKNKLSISTSIKENLFFFKRLTVQAKSVVLSLLSEKQQLLFWSKAINQTGKEARYLKMIGVFKGIPYDSIENLKVNYSQKSLNYNYKSLISKKSSELKDLAIFNDLTSSKLVMVMN